MNHSKYDSSSDDTLLVEWCESLLGEGSKCGVETLTTYVSSLLILSEGCIRSGKPEDATSYLNKADVWTSDEQKARWEDQSSYRIRYSLRGHVFLCRGIISALDGASLALAKDQLQTALSYVRHPAPDALSMLGEQPDVVSARASLALSWVHIQLGSATNALTHASYALRSFYEKQGLRSLMSCIVCAISYETLAHSEYEHSLQYWEDAHAAASSAASVAGRYAKYSDPLMPTVARVIQEQIGACRSRWIGVLEKTSSQACAPHLLVLIVRKALSKAVPNPNPSLRRVLSKLQNALGFERSSSCHVDPVKSPRRGKSVGAPLKRCNSARAYPSSRSSCTPMKRTDSVVRTASGFSRSHCSARSSRVLSEYKINNYSYTVKREEPATSTKVPRVPSRVRKEAKVGTKPKRVLKPRSLTPSPGTSRTAGKPAPVEKAVVKNELLWFMKNEGLGMTFDAMGDALVDQLWKQRPGTGNVTSTDYSDIKLLLGDKFQIECLIEELQRARQRARRKSYEAYHHSALVNASSVGVGSLLQRRKLLFVNYFAGSKNMTLKSRMVEVLREYMKNPYTLTPKTYMLVPNGSDERSAFLSDAGTGNTFWIAKSSHGSKGLNLKISKNKEELISFVDSQQRKFKWVAQKYLERPFLIKGRKFDIRTWVLLTSGGAVYVYKQGVCRTSSYHYSEKSLNNLDDHLTHITNHHIQEMGTKFSQYEEGNEMWFDQFDAFMKTLQPPRSFYADIEPQLNKITSVMFQAAAPYMTDPPQPLKAFQLFGFDFLVDADLRVWLLEVNGSPAIAEYLKVCTRHSVTNRQMDMVSDMTELVMNPSRTSESLASRRGSRSNNFVELEIETKK